MDDANKNKTGHRARLRTRLLNGDTSSHSDEWLLELLLTYGIPRRDVQLFGKAALREAIQLFPLLPDSESLDEIREYLRKNLHFSAEATRKRYAAYISRRQFPDGIADQALRVFGKANGSGRGVKNSGGSENSTRAFECSTILTALVTFVRSNG